MPVYVYRCKACGNTEEVLQPITAQPHERHHQLSGDNSCTGRVERIPQKFGGPAVYTEV